MTFFLADLVREEVGGVKAPSRRLQGAVAAIVSDLLECGSTSRDAFRYRSMGSLSYVGEPVGYRAFKDAYDALVNRGYIETYPGKKGGIGGVGTATRMRATAKLIELAASYGIELDRLSDHFGTAPPPSSISEPVVMRKPSKKVGKQRYQGPKLKLEIDHPGIISDSARINALNAFLSTIDITGIKRWTLQRVYCDTGDRSLYGRYGGRLYSPFQNAKREARKGIRIEGEATCEIDIGGSFLTIFHSLVGQPLDTSIDPYAGVRMPRAIVKAYINAAFGHGRFHKRWPKDVIDALENPEDPTAERFENVKVAYPIDRVRMAVENRFPALRGMDDGELSWGHLHYAESEVVLATMEALANLGIPSLPLHDAIIVPVSKTAEAMRVLSEVFNQQLGVKPKLTIKGFPEIKPLAA